MKNILLYIAFVLFGLGSLFSQTDVNFPNHPEHPMPKHEITMYSDFPGGKPAFFSLFSDHFNIPASWVDHTDTLVCIEVLIDSSGRLVAFEEVLNIRGCPECTEEVKRVLLLVQSWIPYYSITKKRYINYSILIFVNLKDFL